MQHTNPNVGHTNTNTMGHPNSNTMGHTNTNNMSHKNATNGRPGTTTAGKPGTMNSGKPGTPGNAHTNTMNNGRPGGANTHSAASRTPPGRQVSLKGGGQASIRPNGQIRSVSRNGMTIQHGLHGGRTIVSTHNGARVVTTGRSGGYVQRNYVSRNGNTYVSRTYVVNNVTYTSVYRSYSYGGYCCYYGYAPAYYWHPAYYGWAYNPWPAPVYYGWGWGAAPWYGYYAPYYYQPYPVYPSAAFWITDWMIAASLQSAYAAEVAASAELNPLRPEADFPLVASLGPVALPAESKVALTKEVKDLLADEIKAQLADEQSDANKNGSKSSGAQSGGGQASGGAPPALDPKHKILVAHDEISVTDDGGQECSLSDGDVISRESDTPDEDKNVDVKVLASKKKDCAVGKVVGVSMDDLEEMYNHFREQLGNGMTELSKKNGSGGLPKAPDTGKQDGEVPAPAPDSSAAKALKDQQGAADQTEADVKQEASSSTGGGSQ